MFSFQSNGIQCGRTWYPVISHFPQDKREEVTKRVNGYESQQERIGQLEQALREVLTNRDGQIIHRAALEKAQKVLRGQA